MRKPFKCSLYLWESSLGLSSCFRLSTCNLLQWTGPHVQHDGAIKDAAPQLKQTMKGKSCHIRFTPPLSSVLHIFLKLQPSRNKKETGKRRIGEKQREKITIKLAFLFSSDPQTGIALVVMDIHRDAIPNHKCTVALT